MAREECLAHSVEREGERMSDWADDKARDWYGNWVSKSPVGHLSAMGSLAALLREVVPSPAEEQEYKDRERARVLAEVRRVVEDETIVRLHNTADRDQQFVASKLMQQILSRLEQL